MNDEIELLKSAIEEIRSLRIQNRQMSLRLQMFDDMMLVLRSNPNYGASQGMGEDIVWKIERFIESQKVVQEP